jgi:hypothetical protein
VSIPGDGRAPDERDGPSPTRPRPEPPARPPDGQPSVPRPPYGQPGYPGSPYDPSPYDLPPPDGPAGGNPAEPPYVYNPYGNYPYPATYPTSPAGPGRAPTPPPRRPGLLHLALLLVVLSALPYVLVGLVAVAGAGQAVAALPPEDLARFQELGIDLVHVIRITGFLLLAVALGFVVLGVLAWLGRRWARALLAVATVGLVLMVATSVLAAGSQGLPLDAGSGVVLAVPLIVASAGVGLLFAPAARDWFARRR